MGVMTEAEVHAAWLREKQEAGYVCPNCGSSNISCYYVQPLDYECEKCGLRLIDDNAGPSIPVLTKEQAERRRPRLFNLPFCEKCEHAPHEGLCKIACEFCKPQPPHIYKFRLA